MRAEIYGGMICVDGTVEEIAILAKLIAPIPLLNALEKASEDAEKKVRREKHDLD